MPTPLQLDPDAICDACGRFGAFHFDGETLCAECYAARGSCCAGEFEGRSCDEKEETPSSAENSPENLRHPPESSR